MPVEWVRWHELSNTQKEVIKARYKPPYTGWLYRTYKGQVAWQGKARRRVR